MLFDLNVCWPSSVVSIQTRKELATKTANELYSLGFHVIAFSQISHGKLVDVMPEITSNAKILSRLTVVMDGQIPQTNHDILALRPLDEKQFLACCKTHICDLISLDLSTKINYLKKTPIKEAMRRGIHFEICYSRAFEDKTNFIANCITLLQITKGKNTIFTSEAYSIMETRGPLDVINLGCLLGLNPDKAKHMISTNCRAVLMSAETRKTYKSVIK